jgi:regulator of replication initiation timing
MVESVKMVKTLMETNRQLRQQIESLQSSVDNQENESFHLQLENRECRDRIEILESVVTCSAQVNDQFSRMDWRAVLADELKTPPPKGDNQAINHMVQLIFDLRKQERISNEEK